MGRRGRGPVAWRRCVGTASVTLAVVWWAGWAVSHASLDLEAPRDVLPLRPGTASELLGPLRAAIPGDPRRGDPVPPSASSGSAGGGAGKGDNLRPLAPTTSWALTLQADGSAPWFGGPVWLFSTTAVLLAVLSGLLHWAAWLQSVWQDRRAATPTLASAPLPSPSPSPGTAPAPPDVGQGFASSSPDPTDPDPPPPWPGPQDPVTPVHVKVVTVADCFAPIIFVNDVFCPPQQSGAVPLVPPQARPSTAWLTLLGEFTTRRPSYLQLLPPTSPDDPPRLWLTSFGLSQEGGLVGIVPDERKPFVQSAAPLLWPNAVTHVASGTFVGVPQPLLLVADGFLPPGKRDGGVWAITDPGTEREAAVCLTSSKGWFYHKAVPFSIAGHEGVLTARASTPLVPFARPTVGELVWLERPATLSPLQPWSVPWRERVLVAGPDVMFDVADLDPADGTVEVFAAEFFAERLTLHSVGWDPLRACPVVALSRTLDDSLGPAYAVTVADLTGPQSHLLVTTHKFLLESEAPRQAPHVGWSYTTLPPPAAATLEEGGSFYAYEIPRDWRGLDAKPGGCRFRDVPGVVARITEVFQRTDPGRTGRIGVEGVRHCLLELGVPFSDVELANLFWEGPSIPFSQCKTFLLEKHFGEPETPGVAFKRFLGLAAAPFELELPDDAPWSRSTIASGFRVKRLGINPGAPGFVYPFYPHRDMATQGGPPHLLLAGDCSDAAYLFRPVTDGGTSGSVCGYLRYELMATIGVDGTVGSLAVGYTATPGCPDDGWAKVFVPVYERDRVYVIKCGPSDAG